MHTKGRAAEQLREKLKLDTCVYLGNDLNDISMFSNALDDNDFIVIANHEDIKLLVLEDENVNKFLNKMSRIMRIISIKKQEKQGVRVKYRVNIKEQNKLANQQKKTEDNKRKNRDKHEKHR